MIRIFTTGQQGERWVSMDEVNIVTQGICPVFSSPYILFEHKDFPLGALKAEFKDNRWEADLC